MKKFRPATQRQACQFKFNVKFSADIKYLSGSQKVVADTLSPIEATIILGHISAQLDSTDLDITLTKNLVALIVITYSLS